MIPAFDPGPNRFGRPPVFTAGVGPAMTAVAGEVADGFLVHPVNTRRSLQELTLPALADGARRAGRTLSTLEVVCVTIVVTGRDEEQFRRSHEAVRAQLAFYATTPAYAPVFELHGYGELAPELRRLARADRWDDMAALVPDDLVATIAVVGTPHEIAPKLASRLDRDLRLRLAGEQPGAGPRGTSPRSSTACGGSRPDARFTPEATGYPDRDRSPTRRSPP